MLNWVLFIFYLECLSFVSFHPKLFFTWTGLTRFILFVCRAAPPPPRRKEIKNGTKKISKFNFGRPRTFRRSGHEDLKCRKVPGRSNWRGFESRPRHQVMWKIAENKNNNPRGVICGCNRRNDFEAWKKKILSELHKVLFYYLVVLEKLLLNVRSNSNF